MIFFALLMVITFLAAFTFFVKEPAVTHLKSNKVYKILALGDSYTIGEAVSADERFIAQSIAALRLKGLQIEEARIIATTGWTTDELQKAINEANITDTFDAVTLLIGVNNQYRGRGIDEYRVEFVQLLLQAIQYAGGQSNRVFVLSIPDWGVTPFAEGRDRSQIAKEIDSFNVVNKEEAVRYNVHYVDITPESRKASTDLHLIASDKLHPSAAMYAVWAEKLTPLIFEELKK